MAHADVTGAGEDADPVDFWDCEVLAPMVRASTLPLRLEALRYGASLAFGEEIVDRKMLDAVRVENSAFGTIDFVSPREKVAVFSTCAEERQRVLFQLGTANAALAEQAALLVCKDVRGIDVNMGCPKSFSVKGGMGAALLSRPDVASDILKTLRRCLPRSCALTCKIRMLETVEKTREFMQVCERSGAEAITVHMRRREHRPADRAMWENIVPVWDAVKVPVMANGDFFNRRQIDEFWKHCEKSGAGGAGASSSGVAVKAPGPAGIMIARGAMWNPSVFCRSAQEAPDFEEVVRRYTRTAVRANNTYQNTKWVLASMLAGGTGVSTPTQFRSKPIKAFNKELSVAKSMKRICELIGEPLDAAIFPHQAHTTAYYKNFVVPEDAQVVKVAAPKDVDGRDVVGADRKRPMAALVKGECGDELPEAEVLVNDSNKGLTSHDVESAKRVRVE